MEYHHKKLDQKNGDNLELHPNLDYFRSSTTKGKFIELLGSSFAFFIVILLCFIFNFYVLLLPVIVMYGIIIYDFLQVFRTISKQRKQVDASLNKQEKYKKNLLVLSDNYLSLSQDDEVTLEKWSNFSRIEILDEFIFLEGKSKQNYIFPKKSMSQENFKILKETLLSQLNSK